MGGCPARDRPSHPFIPSIAGGDTFNLKNDISYPHKAMEGGRHRPLPHIHKVQIQYVLSAYQEYCDIVSIWRRSTPPVAVF